MTLRRPRGRGIVRVTTAHDAAVPGERGLVTAFRRAAARAGGAERRGLLEAVLARPDAQAAALGAFSLGLFGDLLGRGAERTLTNVYRRGFRAGADEAQRLVRKQALDPEFYALLRLLNPAAEQMAQMHAARLVRNVTRETREAIRAVIAEAQRRGLGVASQRAEILSILEAVFGLTERQAMAYVRLRDTLVEAGTAPAVVEVRLAAARDGYIRQRALTIARHETMEASNAGVDRTWKQMQAAGVLPPGQLGKWLTARGDRTCPICRPMDGQERPLGELFVSPFDGTAVERPPAHVLCRCTRTLVVV